MGARCELLQFAALSRVHKGQVEHREPRQHGHALGALVARMLGMGRGGDEHWIE